LVLLVVLTLTAGAGSTLAAADAEATFEDDFSGGLAGTPAPTGERWEVLQGDWEAKEGRLVHADASGYAHCRVVANFPIREGIVEVEAIPKEQNSQGFASVGLVGKYVDDQREWWFRYGSYRQINIDGHIPGIDKISLGSVLPEPGRTYRLKLVMRGGLVGVCVDGTTIAIFRDPFGDLAGRPGVFTETHAEFRHFKVTRFPEQKARRLIRLRQGMRDER
jgi:hypothetical protein